MQKGATVASSLRSYLAVLSRRWTVIVPAIVLVPAVVLFISLGQQKSYAANAQVLLSNTNIGASVNGVTDPNAALTADQIVTTQAALAREPAVAERALLLSGVHSTPSDLLNRSSVATFPNADLLQFSVRDPNPAQAALLATNYAKAYTMYRQQVDSQAINAALLSVTQRLEQLSPTGRTASTYHTLSHEQQTLAAMQAAGASDAVLAQPAQAASQVSPQPARDGAIGLALGIVLGLGLAFLMEALDTRVGSVQEIERALELPLLARIPAPFGGRSGVPAAARPSRRIDRVAARVGGPLTESPADSEGSNGDRHQPPPAGVSLPHGSVSPRGNRGSRVRYRDRAKAGEVGRVQQSERVFEQKAPVEAPALAYWRRARRSLATLGEPNGREAEAYRVLKSSLDFVALEHHLKSILLTSGRDYYAKSTTITNLAVTLAQSGRRVLLCELDARRPGIGELFGLQGYPGFTEVVLGHAVLDDVIVPVSASPSLVPAPSDELDPAIGGIGSVGAPVNNQLQGVLEVLPFGGMLPPTPGFLGSRAVAELVEALKLAPAEILLIDAPPLLAHGDALTLSGCVDGVILALPVPVRRPMLGELTRALSTSPRRPLGFITVGGDLPDSGHGVRPHDEIHQRPPSSSARGNGNASALYIAARD